MEPVTLPSPDTCPFIEWAVATRALPGQVVCGDRHVVRVHEGGALIAVVDGLGHGDEARAVADIAVSILEQHHPEPVLSLVTRCHAALVGTRGAVMAVASLSLPARTLTWISVGNVEGQLLRREPGATPNPERLLLRGGLVGGQLPALQAAATSIGPGDVLILASDGVRADAMIPDASVQSPERLAQRILAEGFKGTDDALVLVARYLEHASP
jgi:phosphoserine phosphatase RsbX